MKLLEQKDPWPERQGEPSIFLECHCAVNYTSNVHSLLNCMYLHYISFQSYDHYNDTCWEYCQWSTFFSAVTAHHLRPARTKGWMTSELQPSNKNAKNIFYGGNFLAEISRGKHAVTIKLTWFSQLIWMCAARALGKFVRLIPVSHSRKSFTGNWCQAWHSMDNSLAEDCSKSSALATEIKADHLWMLGLSKWPHTSQACVQLVSQVWNFQG